MAVVGASSGPFRFGPFEVDSTAGELRKQGVRVKLQAQPLQILQVLLESPGEVVTREQLQQRLWPADTFVDFDHGLYNAIKRLREALGDTAETPRFIETVPKLGYRFIGPVNDNRASTVVPSLVPPSEATSPATQGRWFGAATAALLSTGTTAVLLLLIVPSLQPGKVRGWYGGATAGPQIHSLAVLPLKNLSDDPAQEYFSYGMTEELITDLAQISGLKVISHTSVIQFARSSKPLPQIAHELGVDGIVEGTVQRSGNRVRITAQLIYAPEEQHLWAASYDRDVQDVLTLQSSVAAAIVEPIRAKTGPAQTVPRKPPSTPSLSVLEEYFQGKYSLERMASGDGDAGHKAAIGHFKQAISEDPDFAPAYEKLAETYDSDFEWRRGTMVPLEKALLGKALELDPGSADAHLFIAHIKRDYDCDLAGAETEYKEAIRLNSNLAEAHDEFSAYLDIVGRREESIQEAHRAQELDPAGNHESDVMMEKGQYDRQIAQLRKQLEIHPNDGFTYLALIDVYQTAGMQRETVKSMQQAWTLFGFKEIGLGMGKAYASSGYKGAIRYSATQMERLGVEGKVYSPRRIASWYAWIGDKEQSLKWLTAGLAEGNYCWVGLNSDPDFALLHSDPRFQELAKRAAVPR